VATERAGALHAALMPYVGKEKINKRKGKMGRLAEKMAYAGVSESEKPEKPAGEPDPTPSMIAGGAPPSDQTRGRLESRSSTQERSSTGTRQPISPAGRIQEVLQPARHRRKQLARSLCRGMDRRSLSLSQQMEVASE
jgi:hypothetical protein